MMRAFFVWLGVVMTFPALGAVLSEPGVYSLPMNCSELLPDPSPFTQYFEAVGRGLVSSNRPLATKIFKVIAIRERISDAADRQRDQHPIDVLIRKTLCFYRDTKEPLKAVTYDDPDFVSYLKGAMPEIEKKVSEVVYQWEFDQAQRKQFEKIVEKNSQLIQKLKMEAQQNADSEVNKIAQKAKKQVGDP